MTSISTADSQSGGATNLARAAVRSLVAVWGACALLVIWFIAIRVGWVSTRILPDPVVVLERLRTDLTSVSFLSAVLETVKTAIIGLAVGAFTGGVTAFVLSDRQSRWLYALLRPYLAFLNSTPRVVLVPLFILVFGIGESGRVALSASLVFFVVFFGVFGAVETLRPEYLRNAHILGASRFAAWRLVTFPGTLLGIFDSLRISASLAILGVVVAEIISTPAGLGGVIRVRSEQFDLGGVFSALFVLGALSAASMTLLKKIEDRALRWK